MCYIGFRSLLRIACVPEIVGTFVRAELWDERANCASEARNGSRRDLAQECLKFAVRQLDRIEVRRVLRKIAHARLRLLNGLCDGRSQVDSQLSITTMSLRRSVGTKHCST